MDGRGGHGVNTHKSGGNGKAHVSTVRLVAPFRLHIQRKKNPTHDVEDRERETVWMIKQFREVPNVNVSPRMP